jgi:hypothetical protein
LEKWNAQKRKTIPAWPPFFRVITRDSQADFRVRRKTAVGSYKDLVKVMESRLRSALFQTEKHDFGRLVRIIWGEVQPAVIQAIGKGSVWRTANCKVNVKLDKHKTGVKN